MPTQTPSPGAAGPRILVLDDESGIRTFIQFALAREGLECDLADCGQCALDLAGAAAYDLFLIDIELPDTSGDEVLRRIRSAASAPHQKVLVVGGPGRRRTTL